MPNKLVKSHECRSRGFPKESMREDKKDKENEAGRAKSIELSLRGQKLKKCEQCVKEDSASSRMAKR
jgi:hypothetical protein